MTFITEKTTAMKSANSLATHRSNVNEYLLATELAKRAGHKDIRPGSTTQEKKEAKEKHDFSRVMIDPEEYNHQKERAKHMADAAIEHYKRTEGIDLTKAKHFHVTAGGGALGKVTGSDVKSKENPADVIARLPGKHAGHPDVFRGISAKSNKESTEGNGTERISNLGLKSVSDNLKNDLHTDPYGKMDKFAEDKKIDHLPLTSKNKQTRKEWLRSKGNEKHEADSKTQGAKILNGLRDKYMKHLNDVGGNPQKPENVNKIKEHLLNQHYRVNDSKESENHVPYIVVSGYGTKKGEYGAHAHDMVEHPHVGVIKKATHFTSEPSGDNGTHIYAHTKEHPQGLHVLKVSTMFNSQPMVSSLKKVGFEGTLKPKKIKT